MTTKRVLSILLPILTILIHVFAAVLFVTGRLDFRLPEDWGVDFAVLLSLSAVSAICMHAIGRNAIKWPATAIRLIVFFIIGVPFGDFLDIEYLLLFSLLLDLGYLFPTPAGIVLSVLAIGISSVLQLPMSIYSVPRPAPGFIGMSLYVLIGTTVSVLVIFLRKALDENDVADGRIKGLNDIVSRLMGANRGYLEYASQVEKETTENERTRIIQELHDVVGKAFTNIYAMMDASLKHPPEGKDEDTELHLWAKELAQQGLTETRAVLYRLREIQDTNLGGVEALTNLITTFEKATKIRVEVSWGNLPWRIAPLADTVIYTSVQESLVNSFRHGKATSIHIQFWIDGRHLIVDVADNGTGVADEKKGIGQAGIERRVKKLGGQVIFAGTRDGYRVRITIPKEQVFHGETEHTHSG